MTREEAAEVMLGGPKAHPCAVCRGHGRAVNKTNSERGDNFHIYKCAECCGCGSPRVVEACRTLGLPIPEYWKRSSVTNEELRDMVIGRYP